jgi:hypothetical protein
MGTVRYPAQATPRSRVVENGMHGLKEGPMARAASKRYKP